MSTFVLRILFEDLFFKKKKLKLNIFLNIFKIQYKCMHNLHKSMNLTSVVKVTYLIRIYTYIYKKCLNSFYIQIRKKNV